MFQLRSPNEQAVVGELAINDYGSKNHDSTNPK